MFIEYSHTKFHSLSDSIIAHTVIRFVFSDIAMRTERVQGLVPQRLPLSRVLFLGYRAHR
jgi:hypothetical protein